MSKKFYFTKDQIKDLVEGKGSCFATDEITVKGRKVGYMYKEKPDNQTDSGWRFMAGDETEEYMNDPENMAIYDVNTIANYDQAILPLLDSPVGSAFIRNSSGVLVEDK